MSVGLRNDILFLNQQAESDEGKQGIQYQQFVAELVAVKPGFGVLVQNEAAYRGCQGYPGNKAVTHFPGGQDTEGKHAQYRPVSIAGQDVHGIDDAGIIEQIEHKDASSHQGCHAQVNALAQAAHSGFRFALSAQDVYRKGGGQSSEGRSGGGIG